MVTGKMVETTGLPGLEPAQHCAASTSQAGHQSLQIIDLLG